jgi:hypothetical protein
MTERGTHVGDSENPFVSGGWHTWLCNRRAGNTDRPRVCAKHSRMRSCRRRGSGLPKSTKSAASTQRSAPASCSMTAATRRSSHHASGPQPDGNPLCACRHSFCRTFESRRERGISRSIGGRRACRSQKTFRKVSGGSTARTNSWDASPGLIRHCEQLLLQVRESSLTKARSRYQFACLRSLGCRSQTNMEQPGDHCCPTYGHLTNGGICVWPGCVCGG